jgi:hypothetical protein
LGIPQQADYDLAEIGNAADLVMLKCRTMRHSKTPQAYRPQVREQLQAYVNLVMAFADGFDDR